MAEENVSAVMRTGVLRLAPDMPVREAAARLAADIAAAAPVVDASGRLVGIISEKDFFRPALHASYYQQWEGTVADHMSAKVVALDADADLFSAAEAFLEHPFRAFPVTRSGELVGLLDRGDLLRALLRLG